MFKSGTHRGTRWFASALLVLVIGAAGCTGVDPGASNAPSADASAASAEATRTPQPSATPLPGLPSELVGTWHTDLTPYITPDPLCPNCGKETRLIIHAHGQYAVAGYGPYRPGGSFTMDGDLIHFDRSSQAGSTDCANATYSYELDGDELTFTALEEDPCGRRGDALDGVTYTRGE